jgi:hypothetical protein
MVNDRRSGQNRVSQTAITSNIKIIAALEHVPMLRRKRRCDPLMRNVVVDEIMILLTPLVPNYRAKVYGR